jgi:hypothetical protein
MADDANTMNRTRLGGLFLLAGISLTLAGLFIGTMTYPTGLPSSDAEAAASLTANSGVVTLTHYIRLGGAVLGAVGAFFLVTRTTGSSFPGSAFWIASGLGWLMAAGLSAFRATGMMTLAANQKALPVVFEAARSSLSLMGAVATLLVVGGIAGAFWGEARATRAAIPKPISAAVVFSSLLVMTAVILGRIPETAQAAMYLGYAVYPTLLLMVPFGIKVAWPATSFAWSKPTTRQTDA